MLNPCVQLLNPIEQTVTETLNEKNKESTQNSQKYQNQKKNQDNAVKAKNFTQDKANT